ncbi:MAG: hypothetical protein HC765_14865 [Brachymonas sp.]|nr:hypothetical protein [Brachymonas sp.]
MQPTPPRYVPTLTQVHTPLKPAFAPSLPVQPALAPSSPAQASNAPAAPHPSEAKALDPVLLDEIAQQTRQKLLTALRQHIDLQLQPRIRETVAQLALEHAYKLYEQLQPQIEVVVTQVVADAMQHALAKVSAQPVAPLHSGLPHAASAANVPLKI